MLTVPITNKTVITDIVTLTQFDIQKTFLTRYIANEENR